MTERDLRMEHRSFSGCSTGEISHSKIELNTARLLMEIPQSLQSVVSHHEHSFAMLGHRALLPSDEKVAASGCKLDGR